MSRMLVQLGAPLFSLVGVVLGVLGTYWITRWYHPFRFFGFVRSLSSLIYLVATGSLARASALLGAATKLGSTNVEDRAKSLAGIALVFFGFAFQALGALLWCIDAIWNAIVTAR